MWNLVKYGSDLPQIYSDAILLENEHASADGNIIDSI